jgi:TetR/AcrR family transcriptional regulator, regulator of cefoperazone and chloramphenicol sensitivity
LFNCKDRPVSGTPAIMEDCRSVSTKFRSNLASKKSEARLNLSVDDAKLRLLSVAESLFAERAIESVSLREIAAKAGNGNNNAVQYHFGSKDELVQAIFAWRVQQMEEPRRRLYSHACADGRKPDLADLVKILCLPMLDLVDEDGRHTYAAFITQYVLRHRPTGLEHAADQIDASTQVLRTLLKDIHETCGLSQLDGGDYRTGLIHLIFANMLVLSDSERLQTHSPQAFQARVDATLLIVTSAFESVRIAQARERGEIV